MGGNLSRGAEVSIVVTVTGEVVPARAVRRDGARPGDRVVVTGSLGGSAAGLRVASQRSWSDDERDALRRYMRPTPRVGEAGVLASHGTIPSMMDISDGLALDLSRLCRASRIGARIELARIPTHPAAMPGEALGGGEDYELLATLPDLDAVGDARSELRQAFGVSLCDIGGIIDEGLVAVVEDGTESPFDDRRDDRRLGSFPVAGGRREHGPTHGHGPSRSPAPTPGAGPGSRPT